MAGAKKVVRQVAGGQSSACSILLYGARGSGKNALARLLVEAWLCLSPTEDGADGTCRACAAFSRGTSADFLHIAPTGNSSIIRVGAITPGAKTDEKDPPLPLLEFIRTAPLVAKHRVAMIEQAHRMNSAAFNALLKTLEEPLPHVRIVLTTDAIGSIPPTILSRCLAVACELPAPSEIHRLFPDANEVDLILSEGSPGRAAHILKHADRYRAIYEFALDLPHRPPAGALRASEQFRSICEGIEKALACGARAAQTEALEVLAIALSKTPNADPAWGQRVLEAHRRVIGNVGIGMVLDSLFTSMLA